MVGMCPTNGSARNGHAKCASINGSMRRSSTFDHIIQNTTNRIKISVSRFRLGRVGMEWFVRVGHAMGRGRLWLRTTGRPAGCCQFPINTPPHPLQLASSETGAEVGHHDDGVESASSSSSAAAAALPTASAAPQPLSTMTSSALVKGVGASTPFHWSL